MAACKKEACFFKVLFFSYTSCQGSFSSPIVSVIRVGRLSRLFRLLCLGLAALPIFPQ